MSAPMDQTHDHEAFLRATQPLWTPAPDTTRKTPMPIASAVTSVLFLSYLGLMAPAVAVVVRNPASPDMCAVIGAMLASAISLVHALRRKHSAGLITCVIISSAIIGGIGPGSAVDVLVMFRWLSQDTADALSWRLYAMSGFVLGLGGWAIVQAIRRLMIAGTDKAERIARQKYLNQTDNKHE